MLYVMHRLSHRGGNGNNINRLYYLITVSPLTQRREWKPEILLNAKIINTSPLTQRREWKQHHIPTQILRNLIASHAEAGIETEEQRYDDLKRLIASHAEAGIETAHPDSMYACGNRLSRRGGNRNEPEERLTDRA